MTTTTKDHPYHIGENYFIRLVNFIYVGKLVAVYDKELVFEQCSWIADAGRFNEALAKGLDTLEYSEIEMYPVNRQVILGRAALADCVIYDHPLPKFSK